MFPNKFKTYIRRNPGKLIKSFLCEYYHLDSLNQVIEYFIDDFEQNHSVLSNLNTSSIDNSVLDHNKNLIIKYLYEIILLQQKIPGSDELFHVPFNFSWSDIIKQKETSSDNLFFEYYNTLFNLGIIFFSQAYNNDKEYDFCKPTAQQCSQMWTLYANALWCFNKIKNEISTKVEKDQIPQDLSPEVLDYYSLFCYIYAYKYLIIRSEDKAKEYANNAGLIGDEFTKKMGENVKQRFSMASEISRMYKECYEIATKNGFILKVDNNTLKMFLFQSDLYKAESYHMIYDYHYKVFDKNGTNFPNAIIYLQKELEVLQPWEKKANSITGSIQGNAIDARIASLTNKIKEMTDENTRIYHLPLVTYNEPIPEKMSFFKPKEPEEMSKTYPDISPKDLDSLVPKEVREKAKQGEEEIRHFIEIKLENYMKLEEIDNKIQQIKIPPRILGVSDSSFLNSAISNDLWQRIEEIQQKGGTNGLFALLKEIKERSYDLEKKLTEYLQRLKSEEFEDHHYRNKFGNKWTTEPSQLYNKEQFSNLQAYLMKLSKSQLYDKQKNTEITQNAFHFDILSLSRKELIYRIPGYRDSSNVSLNPTDIKIKQLLDDVHMLSLKNKEMISQIFANLQNNNDLLRGYMDVEKNLLNEQVFLNEQKEKYAKMFEPLRPIENEINEKLSEIQTLCKQMETNPEEIQKKYQQEQQVNIFLHEIDSKIQMYNDTYNTLNKGLTYYKNEKTKIYKALNYVIRYLNRRKEEQYIVINSITRMKPNEPFVPLPELNANETSQTTQQFFSIMTSNAEETDFLDPNKNIITNMGIYGVKY